MKGGFGGKAIRLALAAVGVVLACDAAPRATAQTPGVLYTWTGTPNVDEWAKNFGTNTALLDNNTAGRLTIIETGAPGSTIAISDGGNRRLEQSTASGGLDLTGLSYLEFDLGHTGPNPVNVQFFVQASTGFTYVALGPDVPVTPGVHTYQLPLAGLTYAQQTYIRTVGFNIRDHATDGNLVWMVDEVRSVGTPLTVRDLATHDVGSSDNGLQGAFVNFDFAAVSGSNGAANQTGLSQNASDGSLQWTDLGGQQGAAIGYGNGTVYNGNTFNERLTDLSNYTHVTYRMKATATAGPGDVSIPVQAYFQTGTGFSYQTPGTQNLPVDGAYHDLTFALAGMTNMFDVQFSGVNLGAHASDATINIDLVRYTMVPEPATAALAVVAGLACVGFRRR